MRCKNIQLLITQRGGIVLCNRCLQGGWGRAACCLGMGDSPARGVSGRGWPHWKKNKNKLTKKGIIYSGPRLLEIAASPHSAPAGGPGQRRSAQDSCHRTEPELRPEKRSADRNLLGHPPRPSPEEREPLPLPPDSITPTGDSPGRSPGFILFAAWNR